MLATLLAERRAIACTLSPLAIACVLAGYVAWSSHEPTSIRAPALSLYVPPAGLRPVAVPGQQTAPSPAAQMPGVPVVSVAPAQMTIGQPLMNTIPQFQSPAVGPSESGVFMGLSGFFWGLAASAAIGVAMVRKHMNDRMSNSGFNLDERHENLELGAHPGRAGVPVMAAKESRYMYDEPWAPAGMGREFINEPGVRKPLEDYVGASEELNLVRTNFGFKPPPKGAKLEPWDPLGLCKLSKVSANNPDVAFLREAELKHGRIAMLAFVGILVTSGNTHWPAESFESAAAAGWPNALGEINKTNPGIVAQGLATIALVEGVSNTKRGKWWDGLWFGERAGGGVVAGDLYFDPLKLMPKDPAAADLMRLKELKNGRLAMLAVMGIFAGYLNTGEVALPWVF